MVSADDSAMLDAQRDHWELVLSANVDLFGLDPSESAVAAATGFEEADAVDLLELGAGQGRDTLYLAAAGFSVTALDYTETSFRTIGTKAAEQGASVVCVRHDVRGSLPFPDGSFDVCYSHMLFCMALTTGQLEALAAEVRRVLRPGGLVTYTARTTDDAHHGTGIYRGDDMYEHGGFIVHFFDQELIERLSVGYKIVDRFNFEEAGLPRRLVSVTMRRP